MQEIEKLGGTKTPAPGSGGGKEKGKAHSGMIFGQFMHEGFIPKLHAGLASDEIFAVIQKKEVVVPQKIASQFSADQWRNFFASANPTALSNMNRAETEVTLKPQISVIVHEANPNTWIEVVDNAIYPRILERDRYFKSEGNPY